MVYKMLENCTCGVRFPHAKPTDAMSTLSLRSPEQPQMRQWWQRTIKTIEKASGTNKTKNVIDKLMLKQLENKKNKLYRKRLV